MSQLRTFRKQIDDFMKRHPQSPLDQAQKRTFDGLSYYHKTAAFQIKAKLELFPTDSPLIPMKTSTGDSVDYRRWGKLIFDVDGAEQMMVIYSDPAGHEWFMPFRDATSGDTTYGAGRYLDNARPGLRAIDDSHVLIDFNFAYNPYCAYSPYFSCPLPPRENWLTARIEAGEKSFG